MSTVLDLAAYETLAAFAAVLPPPPSRVLEVGCGHGVLAALLVDRGYDVIGLEPDPEAAAAARARNVKVLEEEILAHRGGPYDVVLFTRSLHHIQHLGDVIVHALHRLEPGGLLLAEEFRREAISLRGAGFYYDSTELLAAAGLPVETSEHPEIDDLLERWEADLAGPDDHLLHTGTRIVNELRRRADVVFERETPYLWRHILGGETASVEDPRIEAAADALQRIERRRIAEGTLPPVGMIVAARRSRTEPAQRPRELAQPQRPGQLTPAGRPGQPTQLIRPVRLGQPQPGQPQPGHAGRPGEPAPRPPDQRSDRQPDEQPDARPDEQPDERPDQQPDQQAGRIGYRPSQLPRPSLFRRSHSDQRPDQST